MPMFKDIMKGYSVALQTQKEEAAAAALRKPYPPAGISVRANKGFISYNVQTNLNEGSHMTARLNEDRIYSFLDELHEELLDKTVAISAKEHARLQTKLLAISDAVAQARERSKDQADANND